MRARTRSKPDARCRARFRRRLSLIAALASFFLSACGVGAGESSVGAAPKLTGAKSTKTDWRAFSEKCADMVSSAFRTNGCYERLDALRQNDPKFAVNVRAALQPLCTGEGRRGAAASPMHCLLISRDLVRLGRKHHERALGYLDEACRVNFETKSGKRRSFELGDAYPACVAGLNDAIFAPLDRKALERRCSGGGRDDCRRLGQVMAIADENWDKPLDLFKKGCRKKHALSCYSFEALNDAVERSHRQTAAQKRSEASARAAAPQVPAQKRRRCKETARPCDWPPPGPRQAAYWCYADFSYALTSAGRSGVPTFCRTETGKRLEMTSYMRCYNKEGWCNP